MRESVPTARYSTVCNVLRQWKNLLILTYSIDTNLTERDWKLITCANWTCTLRVKHSALALSILAGFFLGKKIGALGCVEDTFSVLGEHLVGQTVENYLVLLLNVSEQA